MGVKFHARQELSKGYEKSSMIHDTGARFTEALMKSMAWSCKEVLETAHFSRQPNQQHMQSLKFSISDYLLFYTSIFSISGESTTLS